MFEICSILAINRTIEWRQQSRSGFFIVSFEKISHICSVVSNVDFEQVNVNCTGYIKNQPTILLFFTLMRLTLSWRRHWFLYDNGLRHERVNTHWEILHHECSSHKCTLKSNTINLQRVPDCLSKNFWEMTPISYHRLFRIEKASCCWTLSYFIYNSVFTKYSQGRLRGRSVFFGTIAAKST